MTEEHRGLDLTYLEHAIRTRRMDVIRHAADSTRNTGTLAARSAPACYELQNHEIVISRATLIAVVVLCSILTISSIVLFSVLLCRKWRRSRESRNAEVWGRQSFYRHQDNRRVSLARKDVDDEFSRQYRGVLGTVVETQELGAESVAIERGTRVEAWDDEKEKLRPKFVDVELDLESGYDEGVTRKFEVVAGKVRPKGSDGGARASTMSRVSLFWSEAVGVWMPKRLDK
ncbi:hypothetical protein CB0940_10557 [Cercospora beticola]|uniref:Uncharacterized protein n=1 Tax=Cercospora beticola TaxID=122368 RepID=A0A2G5HSZ8_CERBT|nr:hypothetical protein CB0940_10557 [Cercospora beticola]PIA95659.1 hypothetical protein CB0940_10557 [Cercospora beticola]WPB07279.1 hypothetical protein RHO25_011940 [Cercospora beticola]CAK1367252.1 unnamed protein product [Cercospora beticola]